MAKRLLRFFEFDRAGINAEKRTVPFTFSTETPIDRGYYHEVLGHGEGEADFSLLRNGAPLLDQHDPTRQIGVIESAEIKDGKGHAVVRFGKSALAQEKFQDVQDGICRNCSVGYERTSAISRKTDKDSGMDTIRFGFKPFEISVVSIPADPNTGVNRCIDKDDYKEIMTRSQILFDAAPANDTRGGGAPAPVLTAADRVTEIANLRAAENTRRTTIMGVTDGILKRLPQCEAEFRALERTALSAGDSVEKYNADLLAKIPGVTESKRNTHLAGMTPKEDKRYSLGRALRCLSERKPVDGFEKEISDHLRAQGRGDGYTSDGFLIPADLLVSPARSRRFRERYQRDLNVTTASQGGDLVATELLIPIVEILRARMVCDRFGVQTLSGLEGNIAIPRQTGAATAYTVAEQAALTLATQAIDQISLTPHRIGAYNKFSKQLLLQSSIDVENFMRDDLMKVLAIKIDSMILNGQGGGGEFTGILNTNGVGGVHFGGAATWAQVISFETALSTANADVGKMGYITSPTVRGKWKGATKVSNQASFLWENNLPVMFEGPAPDYGEGTRSNDGVVNGYKAAATNQVLQNLVFFGNWEDAVLAMWGGYDVTIDPYSLAEQATVRIIVNAFADLAVRHAPSFCISNDSGAQ